MCATAVPVYLLHIYLFVCAPVRRSVETPLCKMNQSSTSLVLTPRSMTGNKRRATYISQVCRIFKVLPTSSQSCFRDASARNRRQATRLLSISNIQSPRPLLPRLDDPEYVLNIAIATSKSKNETFATATWPTRMHLPGREQNVRLSHYPV